MRFLIWFKVHIGFYFSYNDTLLHPVITNASVVLGRPISGIRFALQASNAYTG
jgi:hypothetical protein